MRSYQLTYSLAVINIVGFALLGMAAMQGWIERAIEADVTGLVYVIFGVFVIGFVICASRVVALDNELCRLHQGRTTRLEAKSGIFDSRSEHLPEALKARLWNNIAVVRQFASSLVMLGLIGTVVGFIMALSGVGPKTVGDVAGVQAMVAQLVSGMSVALYTTLCGAVLGLWLTVNNRLLAIGTATLYSDILARHGRL